MTSTQSVHLSPDKFSPEGNYEPFPGVTILAMLSESSLLYNTLLQLYIKLEQSPLGQMYTLLPPSSWHMTIFDCVTDRRRDAAGRWPQDLDHNATLEECTQHIRRKLSDLKPGTGPRFKIIAQHVELNAGRDIIRVFIEPSDPDEETVRRLRDRLSSYLGISAPNHETYGFHLTIAYILRRLDGAQANELLELFDKVNAEFPAEVELDVPHLCTFDDMSAYKLIAPIGSRDEPEQQ